jgi:Tol biopolymer transport system component
VAACGRIGFDEAALGGSDGSPPDTVSCTFTAFSPPEPVAELNTTARDWAPSISPNGLVLVFSRQVPGSGQDLFRSTRPALDQPWEMADPFPDVNSTGEEDDPTISADGTELIFGEGALFRSVLQQGTFSQPIVIFNDAGFSLIEGPELSSDGLTLYFNASDGRSQIFTATRSTPQGTFTGFAPLETDPDPTGDAGWPALSTDELEMFFSSDHGGQRDIWRTTRASTSDAFSPAVQVPELSSAGEEFDPELSSDGATIWLSSDRAGGTGHDIYVAERSCL